MDPQNLLGRRIEYVGSKGTVRYSGKLKHDPKSAKIKADDHWLGVEWDDPTRGNHRGVVEGVRYFDCVWSSAGNAGSLIKAEKAEFGVEVFEAFVLKYFKGEEAKSLLANKSHLIENLVALSKTAEESLQKSPNKKQSEFDDEAIIKTSISYKKIEFLGFDNIWKRMKDLKAIQNLSVAGYQVASLGQPGCLGSVFQSLKELSLEDSLIGSWELIEALARELPGLETLWLSKNRLALPASKISAKSDKIISEEEEIAQINNPNKIISEEEEIALKNKQLSGEKSLPFFEHLKAAYLSEMNLTWKDFSKVKHLFKFAGELCLAQNKMSDTENIDLSVSEFPRLKKIDLSENGLAQGDALSRLSGLGIKKLNLFGNKLAELPSGEKFPLLTHLNVSNNQLPSLSVLAQLSHFKGVESLRIGDNPFVSFEDKDHCRLLLIGSVRRLKMLNGSELKKGEKKDGEIYYLKTAFHEFFRASSSTAFTYELDNFYKWARPVYPLIDEMIERYDNPYPVEERFYQDAIRPNKTADPNDLPIKSQHGNFKLSASFCLVNFYKVVEGKDVKLAVKKLPRNVDVGYMKVILKNTLKLASKVQSLKIDFNGTYVELDNDLKRLSDYNSQENVFKIIVIL